MISINNRDPRPIYEQISDSFRRLIISGVLKPDEKLPSVRELASELAINPNTIQRAYRELETDGWCYSVPGKGSFVGAGADIYAGRREELIENMRSCARELEYLGMSREEIAAAIFEGGKKA